MVVDDIPNGFTGFANKNFQYSRDIESAKGNEAVPFDPEKLSHISELDRRWSWVEVDLNAIRHNVMLAKQKIDRRCRLLAVVKADAYGHGAVRVAKTALNSGAEYLGVATIDEAIELREALINAPVLILSEPPIASIPLLLAYKVMPTVYTSEFAIQYAELADAHNIRAPYHLKINTGMNRIGVRHDEVLEFMKQINFHRALDLVGTFTHFATADTAETLDFQIQVKRFFEAVHSMQAAGINPGIVHASNSAALFRYPDVHFDMVRMGISLYGIHACKETRHLADLQPAMSVKARVVDVRSVAMSEGVSYGMSYRSPGSVIICTLPIGYADGLSRALSDRIDFIYHGQAVRQVGAICMDQCMFEVDMRTFGRKQRLSPQIGDEVIILGRQDDKIIAADAMAIMLGTVPHEVTTGFSHRMPRIYV